VTLIPNGELSLADFILIEYNSIGHDGAFAFRNAMKTADASIEVGYNVKVEEIQANNSTFQQDFAASPPDFMIKHPYADGLVVPAIGFELFSSAAFVSQKKLKPWLISKPLW
jgi:hypothetical protein